MKGLAETVRDCRVVQKRKMIKPQGIEAKVILRPWIALHKKANWSFIHSPASRNFILNEFGARWPKYKKLKQSTATKLLIRHPHLSLSRQFRTGPTARKIVTSCERREDVERIESPGMCDSSSILMDLDFLLLLLGRLIKRSPALNLSFNRVYEKGPICYSKIIPRN